MVRPMILAGLFAALLFIGLIVGDWVAFGRLTPEASRYGCLVARVQDRLARLTVPRLTERFDHNGLLVLPHGVARFFPDRKRILLRPQYRLFSMKFRTAWPIKGAIDVAQEGETVTLLCFKRIPWSSAILTLVWFALVGLGTVTFLVLYLLQGGASSFSGVLMGASIAGIGLLVLAFGIVTVTMAYRLESSRLTLVYQELRTALAGTNRHE